ncbi:hypothetical protein H0H93_000135 [Arthromyces matolae]|nr:hypothetical protein H0H93_000135 [Arthromyces matolae]
MDFIPRYAQPFTYLEALKLDVAVITEEIARLQNSLLHLKHTQAILQECIDAEPSTTVDPELTNALEENKTVIGSQEERILLLKLVLTEKGVHYGKHYDRNAEEEPTTTAPTSLPEEVMIPPPQPSSEDDHDGVHL